MNPRKAAITLFAALALPGAAHAATFVVDTTSDASLPACTAAPADCSLRGALGKANLDSAADRIEFAIPPTDAGCNATTGVCTIRPTTLALPTSTEPLAIDGYTQPGAGANTRTPADGGVDTQIRIALDGTAVDSGSGLATCGLNVGFAVRGLAIYGFRNGSGISVCEANGTGTVAIEGNFLGLDAAGTRPVPLADNNVAGITIASSPFGGAATFNARIGGTQPAQRNVISGNRNDGLRLTGLGHTVLGNLVGTDPAGTGAIGNGQSGITVTGGSGTAFDYSIGDGTAGGRNVISGNAFRGLTIGNGNTFAVTGSMRGNFVGVAANGTDPLPNALGMRLEHQNTFTVGGTLPGDANVFAFNTLSGISFANFRARAIGNRVHSNGEAGHTMNAGDNGIAARRQANDAGDADNSVNRGQNFPEITSYALGAGMVTLGYRVDSTSGNAAYPLYIEFHRADGDEIGAMLGTDTYTEAEAQATKTIDLPLPPGVALTLDDVVIASATDADGNTSELAFYPMTLTILGTSPSPSPLGTPYSVSVRADSNSLFKPSGFVRVTDTRGGACDAPLVPTAVAGRSEGQCQLTTVGPPAFVVLTAKYDIFRGAFALANGEIPQQTTQHQLIEPPPLLSDGFESP